MDLKEILSISGKPGLYKMVAQTKTGVVVESLLDGKRFTAFTHERISSLEEISIYAEEEDIPIRDVFRKIFEKENGKTSIGHKAPEKELRDYLLEVVPNFDQERVYKSDIKKIIMWYNILADKNMLEFEGEETENDVTREGPDIKPVGEDQPDVGASEKENKNENNSNPKEND